MELFPFRETPEQLCELENVTGASTDMAGNSERVNSLLWLIPFYSLMFHIRALWPPFEAADDDVLSFSFLCLVQREDTWGRDCVGTSYYQYSLLKVIYLLDSRGPFIKRRLPYSDYSWGELDFHSDEKDRPKKVPDLKETINYMHIFIFPICLTPAGHARTQARDVEGEWWWDAAKAVHLPPFVPNKCQRRSRRRFSVEPVDRGGGGRPDQSAGEHKQGHLVGTDATVAESNRGF